MGVGLVPLMASRVEMNPWAPLILAVEALSAAVGYGALLYALRNKLSADAPIDGRHSITAGVVAPIVIMLSLMQGPHPGTPAAIASLPAVGGALLAFAMFFAWLAKPPSGTGELAAGVAHGALPDAAFDSCVQPQAKVNDRTP